MRVVGFVEFDVELELRWTVMWRLKRILLNGNGEREWCRWSRVA